MPFTTVCDQRVQRQVHSTPLVTPNFEGTAIIILPLAAVGDTKLLIENLPFSITDHSPSSCVGWHNSGDSCIQLLLDGGSPPRRSACKISITAAMHLTATMVLMFLAEAPCYTIVPNRERLRQMNHKAIIRLWRPCRPHQLKVSQQFLELTPFNPADGACFN